LRKATVSYDMSVCSSAWNNSAPTGRIFMKFYSWVFFDKLSRKIQVSLKSDQNNRYFTWRPLDIFDRISLGFSSREMFQTKVVEEIKTYILCLMTFFDNCAVYEIMWNNIVERGRPQMTIWRMRIACWVVKATYTHTHTHTHTFIICNSHCFSTATIVARTPVKITLYAHSLHCR
jgi:hypothetical protein